MLNNKSLLNYLSDIFCLKQVKLIEHPQKSILLVCRVKFGKRELLVNGNFTSLVNGNPILLQIYALDFIQTHVNLEFDTCIFTGVEKYIIFDRDYERYNAKLKY